MAEVTGRSHEVRRGGGRSCEASWELKVVLRIGARVGSLVDDR